MARPSYDDDIDARAALAEASDKARAEGKRVAVLYGADWCPDCTELDKALDHHLVRPIVEPAFVVVRIGVGNRDRNLDLMAEHGLAVERGIPALAVLEADGALVGALVDGELGNARALLPVEIATLFHRFAG